MKAYGVLVMFLAIGSSLMCLVFSCKGSTSTIPGMLASNADGRVMTMESSKLLTDNERGGGDDDDEDRGSSSINLEDYRPIDPVPSSKAKVRPIPIEHGTPIMPYIPKPPPPIAAADDCPNHGGLP